MQELPRGLAQRGLRVGFVLLSPPHQAIPSTRVAVLNMLPLLTRLGHHCQILFAPPQPTERPELPGDLLQRAGTEQLDIVVFQKVAGASVLSLVKGLRSAGIASCFMFCDVIDHDMVEATDGSVVVTDFLRSLYPARLQPRMHVVHDGIERPDVVRPTAPVADARRLRAVLVTSAQLWNVPVIGMPPPWLEITVVGRYAQTAAGRWREARWALRKPTAAAPAMHVLQLLLHPRVRLTPWSEDGVYRELQRADVGVIPVDTTEGHIESGVGAPDWARKSENRLTLMMSAGLPVVASRVPAYESVVVQGRNAFLADNRSEWLAALQVLRDASTRQQVGAAARAAVLPRFSLDRQAQLLSHALLAITAHRQRRPQ